MDKVSRLDKSDPCEPSTHAKVTLFAEGGVCLAVVIACTDEVPHVIEHYKQVNEVWVIQIYVNKAHCIGSVACPAHSGTLHHLWADRTVTHRRLQEGGWSTLDSLALENDCTHVIHGDELLAELEKQIQQQHAAQKHFMSILRGDVLPEDPEEELN
jgi:hypothetical protein